MNLVKPVIGQWYRGAADDLFEVVAIDDEDETIEVQYFDGSVAEMDFDAWNEQMWDNLLENADAPEDWSGSVDVGVEDLGRDFEDNVQFLWADSQDRALRR